MAREWHHFKALCCRNCVSIILKIKGKKFGMQTTPFSGVMLPKSPHNYSNLRELFWHAKLSYFIAVMLPKLFQNLRSERKIEFVFQIIQIEGSNTTKIKINKLEPSNCMRHLKNEFLTQFQHSNVKELYKMYL